MRRLWLPLVFFLGFSLMCLLVYQHLEGLRWQDALFWIVNPHAIEYRRVRDATKFFSIFVYFGVFAFQIWVAERLLITVFNRQRVEAWRTMVNDISIDKLCDHFIICGYGQVGRTVVDRSPAWTFLSCSLKPAIASATRSSKDKVLAIQGDAKRHDILQAAGIERARGV